MNLGLRSQIKGQICLNHVQALCMGYSSLPIVTVLAEKLAFRHIKSTYCFFNGPYGHRMLPLIYSDVSLIMAQHIVDPYYPESFHRSKFHNLHTTAYTCTF